MPPSPPYPEPVEVRHEKGARRVVVDLGGRPRRLPTARLPAQLVPVRRLPGPRAGRALPRARGPGARAPRGRRQLRGRPHLAGRPQHRHLQLPAAARALPVRRLRRREALGRDGALGPVAARGARPRRRSRGAPAAAPPRCGRPRRGPRESAEVAVDVHDEVHVDGVPRRRACGRRGSRARRAPRTTSAASRSAGSTARSVSMLKSRCRICTRQDAMKAAMPRRHQPVRPGQARARRPRTTPRRPASRRCRSACARRRPPGRGSEAPALAPLVPGHEEVHGERRAHHDPVEGADVGQRGRSRPGRDACSTRLVGDDQQREADEQRRRRLELAVAVGVARVRRLVRERRHHQADDVVRGRRSGCGSRRPPSTRLPESLPTTIFARADERRSAAA